MNGVRVVAKRFHILAANPRTISWLLGAPAGHPYIPKPHLQLFICGCEPHFIVFAPFHFIGKDTPTATDSLATGCIPIISIAGRLGSASGCTENGGGHE